MTEKQRRTRAVLLVAIAHALVVGACGYATLRPSPSLTPVPAPTPTPTPVRERSAMIAWGITDSWRVTEQEALHELDFIPVFPRVLLPGVDPAPSIVVVLDRIGQPELTMTYGAVKSPAPMVIAIEEARSSDAANKPYWRDTTALNWTHTEVRGLPIAYSFVSPTGRVDPSSDFWSAWQYRGVSYQLRVSWAGATPPGPETTRKEQQALAIIEGLLAAADGQ